MYLQYSMCAFIGGFDYCLCASVLFVCVHLLYTTTVFFSISLTNCGTCESKCQGVITLAQEVLSELVLRSLQYLHTVDGRIRAVYSTCQLQWESIQVICKRNQIKKRGVNNKRESQIWVSVQRERDHNLCTCKTHPWVILKKYLFI